MQEIKCCTKCGSTEIKHIELFTIVDGEYITHEYECACGFRFDGNVSNKTLLTEKELKDLYFHSHSFLTFGDNFKKDPSEWTGYEKYKNYVLAKGIFEIKDVVMNYCPICGTDKIEKTQNGYKCACGFLCEDGEYVLDNCERFKIIARCEIDRRVYAVYKYGYADYLVIAPGTKGIFGFETDEDAIRYFAEKCWWVPVNQLTNF
jgi:hypothetical protein